MLRFLTAIFFASLALFGSTPVGQLAHAGAGALKEQLKGGDPLAGAIGAVVAETVAESKALTAGDRALEKTLQVACNADHKLSKAEFDALLKENLDTEMHRCVLTGQLAGASAAFLAGRDVASAQSAAQNATENNFALTTAVAIGAGAVLVAANVYDYYQAYTEGGWNAVQAKWNEERALDTSLATAGAGAGIPLGPVGSTVGAAGGAIVGNATLRTKSILQRLIKKTPFKTEKKATQLEFDFVKNLTLGQSGNVGETVVDIAPTTARPVIYQSSLPLEVDPSSKFRLVRKIPAEGPTSQFTSKTLSKKVEWTAPTGTQQTYHVYQRNDIDWYRVRTKGHKEYIGKTNLEAAQHGFAPELADGSSVNLHHLGQDSRGPLAEISASSHSKYSKQLHQQFGYRKQNSEHPVDRSMFNQERSKYWMDRAMEVENGQK